MSFLVTNSHIFCQSSMQLRLEMVHAVLPEANFAAANVAGS